MGILMETGTFEVGDIELWRLFLDWSQGVHATVDQALTASADLSVSEFELMSRVWSQPTHELPQHDLTVDLGWSRSRCSHLLNRLESRGFVAKHDLGQGKQQNVRLTDPGRQQLEKGLRAHRQAFRSALLDQLSPTQRSVLQAVMGGSASSGPFCTSPDSDRDAPLIGIRP
ncbi:MarR family winged helix-turn-helix transcriptional regulator [Corynebacterium sp. A21]|uniref:MarR family winged helix-turn-helix transcriptional regulator n=1 Tax=Corynebacterium sp. A21 TaxID=3457318 RepID=UPI003FCFB768